MKWKTGKFEGNDRKKLDQHLKGGTLSPSPREWVEVQQPGKAKGSLMRHRTSHIASKRQKAPHSLYTEAFKTGLTQKQNKHYSL